jgi:hypothetical protein
METTRPCNYVVTAPTLTPYEGNSLLYSLLQSYCNQPKSLKVVVNLRAIIKEQKKSILKLKVNRV